jgi:hypothetical protein
LFDGGRLIAARLIIAVQLEIHRKGLLLLCRAMQKPSLYPDGETFSFCREVHKDSQID